MLAVDGALGEARRAAGVGDRRGGEGVDLRIGAAGPLGGGEALAPLATIVFGIDGDDTLEFAEPRALRVGLGVQVVRHQIRARAAVAQDLRLLGSRQRPVHAHPDGAEPLRGQEGDHDVDVVG